MHAWCKLLTSLRNDFQFPRQENKTVFCLFAFLFLFVVVAVVVVFYVSHIKYKEENIVKLFDL